MSESYDPDPGMAGANLNSTVFLVSLELKCSVFGQLLTHGSHNETWVFRYDVGRRLSLFETEIQRRTCLPNTPFDKVLRTHQSTFLHTRQNEPKANSSIHKVPINFVTVPGVSFSAACFPAMRFEDHNSGECLSNLLAVGFRRFEIDLYWGRYRRP